MVSEEKPHEQYIPGSASLVAEVDSELCICTVTCMINVIIFITERLLVVLRDGRTLIGYLRSVDQFGNV